MFLNFSLKEYKYKRGGFTLIEMLMSVALFSIVLVIIMGSIITIIDVNRKAQSLTSIMNNMNFALESLTRTIKTGTIKSPVEGSSVFPRPSITILDQDETLVRYTFKDVGDVYTLVKEEKEDGESLFSNEIPVLSTQVHLVEGESGFKVFNSNRNSNYAQPRVLLILSGYVQITPKDRSKFIIQTTVSERNLDI